MSGSVLGVASVVAVLLCSLTAGFLFAFAVVVMPGLRALEDGPYLRAFQVVDRVIQDGQPLFMLMWVGSILAVLAAMVLGMGRLAGVDRMLLVGAGALWLGGVHLPTIAVNIPLNNRLQGLDIDELDAAELREARAAFEPRWDRWNRLRTALACLSAALMTTLLVIL